jgi:hypothetical protein
LKPRLPELDHAITLPAASVMVILRVVEGRLDAHRAVRHMFALFAGLLAGFGFGGG